MPAAPGSVMRESEWRSRQREHAGRVRPWIAPRLERRRRGERHPVDDFLFEYYSFRPAQLARWHPGAGALLTGDVSEWARVRGYAVDADGARVREDAIDHAAMRHVATLLRRTAERPEALGCFGRHEWAMVYRQGQDQVRHASWPLRLSPRQIARVVESSPLRCTHFDAFRFYAPEAIPLNMVQPTRATQADHEQPGCLHAAMDLYKWAYRCYPVVGADLTADLFALAREIREVDMRAAPYDLSPLGYAPIPIETPEGRAEFVERQREFARRGQEQRHRLLGALDAAVSASRA
ncbi:MAG: 3-methyladenine DNA glycosylase [bacterium]